MLIRTLIALALLYPIGPKIVYTHTDEAPMLATYSLLPILQRFASTQGIDIETRDISVAGRILSNFKDYLKPEQVRRASPQGS